MNLEKAKVLLEKVNGLMKSMEMAPDQVASIEKDLMKNYLRQLYEVFQENQAISQAPVATKKVERLDPGPSASKVEEKTVVFEIEEERVSEPIRSNPAPIEPTPEPEPEPVKEEPRPEPPAVKVEEPVQPAPKEEPAPIVEKPRTTYIDPELEEIFQIQTAKELSEKLSQLPIPDLTKAFGLNEKIFTINELFGGNAELFTNIIKSLNKMDDFQEAKSYLIDNVAQQEDWSAPAKRKKAIEFIKIVKRRYN
ncbi:MAG: hypothetical protein KDC24_11325 [Saprospiraceae bacterium]|nr:hypothetical protein [Saprospiraceae bacterium]